MEKTIEQLAKEYAEWCYPYDEQMRFQCELHFEAGAEAMRNVGAAKQERNTIYENINGAISVVTEAADKAGKIIAITTVGATQIPRACFSVDMLQNLVWLSLNRDNIELERTASGTIVVRKNGKALTLREIYSMLANDTTKN